MPNDDKKTVETPAGKIEVDVKAVDQGGDKTPQNLKAENQTGTDKKPETAVVIPSAGPNTLVQKTIVEGAKGAVATGATAMGIAPGVQVGETVMTAESSADAAAKAEQTVQMNFPRRVVLTVDHSRQVIFEAGLQPVPVELANHAYLKNNGVTLYDGANTPTGAFGGTQFGVVGHAPVDIEAMRKMVEDADKKKAEEKDSPQGKFDKFMQETSGGFHATSEDWTTVGRTHDGWPVVKGSPADITNRH